MEFNRKLNLQNLNMIMISAQQLKQFIFQDYDFSLENNSKSTYQCKIYELLTIKIKHKRISWDCLK